MATRRYTKKKIGRRVVYRSPSGKFISKAEYERRTKKRKPKPVRGPKGKYISKAEADRLKRSEAAKKGWHKRRAAKKVQPARDARGRFLSKKKTAELEKAKRRSAAAKKGWETRKRKTQARKLAAQRAAETRKRKKLDQQRRSEAAKLGWKKRRQKKLEKAFEETARKRTVEEGPSPALRSLFTDPRWLDGSWHQFEDGKEEGQIITAPGPDPAERLIEVEQAVSNIIRDEPVWVQVGVQHMPESIEDEDLDRYDKYGGQLLTLTYPRKAVEVGAVFLGAREIATNLINAGFKITGLVVRVVFGERPERFIPKQ